MRRNIPSTQALACFEVAARHELHPRRAGTVAHAKRRVAPDPGAGRVLACNCSVARAMAWCSRLGWAHWAPGGALAAGSRTRHARRHGAPGRGWHVVAGCGAHVCHALADPRLPQLARQHPTSLSISKRRRAPSVCRHHVRRSAVCGHRRAGGELARCPGAAAHARRCGAGCSPQLLEPRRTGAGVSLTRAWPPSAGGLPLLQQSTRPYGWRQWFEAMAEAPHALRRSAIRAVLDAGRGCHARSGRGTDPALLIEAELASGELVVVCARPLRGERATISSAPRRHRRPCWRLQRLAGDHGRPLAHRASSYKRPFGSKVSSLQIMDSRKDRWDVRNIGGALRHPVRTLHQRGADGSAGRRRPLLGIRPVPVPLVEVVDRSARGRPHRRRARGPWALRMASPACLQDSRHGGWTNASVSRKTAMPRPCTTFPCSELGNGSE